MTPKRPPRRLNLAALWAGIGFILGHFLTVWLCK